MENCPTANDIRVHTELVKSLKDKVATKDYQNTLLRNKIMNTFLDCGDYQISVSVKLKEKTKPFKFKEQLP